MNRLCSLRLPLQFADGTWRDPDDPRRQTHVAHLTNSTSAAVLNEGRGTSYDLYRCMGQTV
jgi:hypothetical protein